MIVQRRSKHGKLAANAREASRFKPPFLVTRRRREPSQFLFQPARNLDDGSRPDAVPLPSQPAGQFQMLGSFKEQFMTALPTPCMVKMSQ